MTGLMRFAEPVSGPVDVQNTENEPLRDKSKNNLPSKMKRRPFYDKHNQ